MKFKLNTKKRIAAFIAVILILVIAIGYIIFTAITGSKVGQLNNGGFESWIFGKASSWTIYDYEQTADEEPSEVKIERDKTGGIDGSSALMIEIAGASDDVRLYQEVKVRPSTNYKLTVSVKVDGVIEKGAGAGLSIYDQRMVYPELMTKDTQDEWVTLTAYAVTGADQKTVQLAVGLGGFGAVSEGKIWVDNVVIEEIAEKPEKLNNMFAPPNENSNPHILLLPEFASKLIFFVCSFAVIVFVFTLVKRSERKRREELKEELEEGLNGENQPEGKFEEPRKLKESEKSWKPGMKLVNKTEILLMVVMTVAYMLFAMYNLGDMKAPQTYFTPEYPNRGEYIIVSLDGEQEISRIMYNTNLTSIYDDGKNKTTAYKIQYLNSESGLYEDLMDIKDSGFYKWHYADVGIKTDSLKIISVYPGLKINEMGFLKREGQNDFEIIEPLAVAELVANGEHDEPSAVADYEKWFDEQDTIVDTPSFMNSTYFDEIYFPRTAYENINNLEVYEITHPPLGKIIQATGILVFGMNPFGWRIMGTLFGAFMIPLMYLIAKKMFNNTFFSFMAAALMLFDTMHFAQTRLATIDSYTAVFIMLMYYFMYDVFIHRPSIEESDYKLSFKKYLLPLALSGVFFGIGSATKWIGVYAGFGLAILFFISKGIEINSHKKLPELKPEVKEEKWYKNYLNSNVRDTIAWCIAFFVIVPIVIYALSYIPYVFAAGEERSLLKIVMENQDYMYNYHSGLESGHGYSSEWWQWIFDLRPIWYYVGTTAAGFRSTIASFGNPVIWWSGFVALFSSCYIALKKKDDKIIFPLVGYVCQLFPWMLVFRACFIYHYFTCLPFLILFIVYVAKHLYESKAIKKWHIITFMIVVGVTFFLFYPAISGTTVQERFISMLKIMQSWSF